jgi:hypothetical protein
LSRAKKLAVVIFIVAGSVNRDSLGLRLISCRDAGLLISWNDSPLGPHSSRARKFVLAFLVATGKVKRDRLG